VSAYQHHIASMLDQAWMVATHRNQYSASQVALAIRIIRQHSIVR